MSRTSPRADRPRFPGRPTATLSACFLAALLIGIPTNASAAGPLVNQLREHSSPYLKLHGEDPVAWQDWGKSAFEAAQADGRLILVSVGYFACHWCHVMQRESYRNPGIAAQINADFVPIKVDRERHPGIDARLIDFAERTAGRAGWPLNVFLTPDGYPLVAILYQPPERFAAILDRLATRWRSDPSGLRELARRGHVEIASAKVEPVESVSPSAARAALFRTAMEYADTLGGGFGHQAKFPMVPMLNALLDGCLIGDAPTDVCEFITITLDHMATLGLRDALHGGFFRYTVDPDWRTPHFEKMLYDNAQLAALYLRASSVFERPAYADVAFSTLDFVLAEMRSPDGGYISSLSAIDDKGVEGGDYLWTREQLTSALTVAQFQAVSRIWDLGTQGANDAGFLPRLPTFGEAQTPEFQEAMFHLRSARGPYRPPRDDKVIAAWNGLLLRALVLAATHPGGARFQASADSLASFVRTHFITGNASRRVANDPNVSATLEDHVLLADGLDAWADWRHDAVAKAQVASWLATARSQFHGPGGWRRDRDDLLRYGEAQPILGDDSLPSASAVWMRMTTPDRPEHREAALALAAKDPFSYPTHIVYRIARTSVE
ncbi:MAG: thioredoxin domain-containing protein [Gammaproteobacteria bacterium]|nr:thioredoxin domain-containing protein [Gammaproteobacteria bacterium]MCP5136185.1 thioredoxin domain-containing protein [Gammaproteobacteria bacterium]